MGEIKKQSISNTILSYIGAFIGFVSLIYIQPYFLGAKQIGLLKLIYSFSWIVAMMLPLGMGNVTMRFFSKFTNQSNKHNGYFALLFLLVSLGAVIILVLFLCFQTAFKEYYRASPEFVPYYYYCFVFAYIFALISVYNLYCSSLLKTSFTVFLTDVYSRLGFILVIAMFYFGLLNETGLVISYMAVYAVQLILLVGYLYRLGNVTFSVNWQFFKSLDKRDIYIFALVMMFTSFASLGIKIIDGLMLGHYIDNMRIIGVYSVCAFVPTILEIPFNSMERIVQPKVAHAWHINNTHEIGKIYEMSSRYLFFIGGCLFCCLYAGIDFIFSILPPEYAVGRGTLLVLALSSLFNLATGVNTTIITVSSKYFITSGLLLLLIGAGIGLNMLLIPAYGITGAAIATFFAIGAFNLLKYIYILLRFKMQPFSRHTAYILLCIGLSVGFIWLLPQGLHPFVKALAGCAFTAMVFSVMNIRFNTIEEVNKVFRKFRLIK